MAEMKDLYQAADWKKEKHAPVIEAPDSVKKGDAVQVAVSVGKEIAAPQHHPAPHPVDRGVLPARGRRSSRSRWRASISPRTASRPTGPDTSTVYANPSVHVLVQDGEAGHDHGLLVLQHPRAVGKLRKPLALA